MRVVLIDYGSGNLHSAAKSLERAAREDGLDAIIEVSDAPQSVLDADRIVLPGVGAYADCLAGVLAIDGLRDALEQRVIKDAVPYLGICVGMQLMAARGLEFGIHKGFGWIPGDVTAILPSDSSLKIPHMGWNKLIHLDARHPVLEGVGAVGGGFAYFVHSYAMKTNDKSHVLGEVDYGGPVTAVVGHDNMVGTQFHPEKSQLLGLKLLANFLKWSP